MYLQEQRNGAVHKQQRHDGVDCLCVFGEQHPEGRAKGGPRKSRQESDEGDENGEQENDPPLSVVDRDDIGFHGHDAVEIELGIDELESEGGEIAVPTGMFSQIIAAAEGLPRQPEHICRADEEHGGLDDGDPALQYGAEYCAEQLDEGKAGEDSKVKGHSAFESAAAGVAHGHDIIGTWCECSGEGNPKHTS